MSRASARDVSRGTYDGRSRDEYRAWSKEFEWKASVHWKITDWDSLRRSEKPHVVMLRKLRIRLASRFTQRPDDQSQASRDELMVCLGLGRRSLIALSKADLIQRNTIASLFQIDRRIKYNAVRGKMNTS